MDNNIFADQLRTEGIMCKGFGTLPKYAMLDRDLTIEAKAIYAYFRSYAGNGNTTFPGRDKILADLSLSKNGYYKHRKLLIEQGYLKVTQEKVNNSRLSKNIYTLVNNPKKFQDKPENPSQKQVYSRIRCAGLQAAGYGMIPKAVMIDARLSLKAKGVYAYFCSFTGAGNIAFPEKATILYHLGICENTYYKYYQELVNLNYIMVVQHHTGGRLRFNEYILCDNPDTEKAAPRSFQALSGPSYKILENGKIQYSKLEDTEKEDTEKEDTEKEDRRKEDTNKNSQNKNNTKYNQSLNQQTAKPEGSESERVIELYPEEEFHKVPLESAKKAIIDNSVLPYQFCQQKDLIEEIVHWMTGWDALHPNGVLDRNGNLDELGQRVYDLFNLALIEMLTTTDQSMILNRAVVSYVKVVDKLNERAVFVDGIADISEIMNPAMEHYRDGATQPGKTIRHPKAYMKSCIWEAMEIGDIRLHENLRRDGY